MSNEANYPISFTDVVYVALSSEYISHSVDGNTFLPSGATTIKITFWNAERAKRYIVLGK